jgi:hypothetical protein
MVVDLSRLLKGTGLTVNIQLVVLLIISMELRERE